MQEVIYKKNRLQQPSMLAAPQGKLQTLWDSFGPPAPPEHPPALIRCSRPAAWTINPPGSSADITELSASINTSFVV